MWVAMRQWREDNRVDEITLTKDMEEMCDKIIPGVHTGVDKLGRPLFIQRTGWAMIGVINRHVQEADVLRFHTHDMERMMERCREQSKKTGRKIETAVNLFDLDGLSIAFTGLMSVFQKISAIDEDNYPETLGSTIIINAPSAFPFIWNIVKQFLDPVVASKMVILSADYHDELLALIDAENLPEEYGGTNPLQIPKLVEEEVLKELDEQEAKTYNLTDIDVAAGSKHHVVLPLEAGKSMDIDWFFRTAYYEVGFSVYIQPVGTDMTKDEDAKVLFQEPKAQSHWVCLKGSVTVKEEAPSQVVFQWDNYASWVNGKSVRYQVRAVPTPAAK